MKTESASMGQVTLRHLKQYLDSRSREELVHDIVDLFNKSDMAKDYYQARLLGGYDENVLDKYKERVKEEFFPEHGYGDARLPIAGQAVSDYKKVSTSPEGLADLMLFYVEMGVRFTIEYGDIDEPFYRSMERMYEQALKLIVKRNLQEGLAPRARKIVRDTRGIGWGFHDQLSDVYDQYLHENIGD